MNCLLRCAIRRDQTSGMTVVLFISRESAGLTTVLRIFTTAQCSATRRAVVARTLWIVRNRTKYEIRGEPEYPIAKPIENRLRFMR